MIHPHTNTTHSIRQRRRRHIRQRHRRRRERVERAVWLGYVGLLLVAEGLVVLAGLLAGFH